MNDLFSKLRSFWPFILAFIGLLSWVVSQAVTASDFKNAVARNADKVEKVEEKVESVEESIDLHEIEGIHPKLNEKLIRLESDVSHIKTNQNTNFNDIKDTLNIMQEDIKDMNRRSHRHR